MAVLVPAQFHVPVALAALDMNKHVFVEKPLAHTLDEADRLIARAQQSDRRIVVGFNLRKHRLIEQARKFVQDGTIGKIEAIRSCWTSAIRYRRELPDWRNSRELGGGALFEIGVHHFDLWRFLLDSEVASIHAYSKTKHGLDETVSVSAQMANGVPVSALFSEQTSDANELEILGRKGRLRLSIYEFDGLYFQSILSSPGGIAPRIAGFKEFLLALPTGLKIARQGGDYLMTYQKEWQDFMEAIRHGRAVSASLSDGRKALEITLAAIDLFCTGTRWRLTAQPAESMKRTTFIQLSTLANEHTGDTVTAPSTANTRPVEHFLRQAVRATAVGTLQDLLSSALGLPLGLIAAALLSRTLGAEGYGVFSVALSIVLLVEVSITFGFSRTAVKFVAEAADWQPVASVLINAQFLTSDASSRIARRSIHANFNIAPLAGACALLAPAVSGHSALCACDHS